VAPRERSRTDNPASEVSGSARVVSTSLSAAVRQGRSGRSSAARDLRNCPAGEGIEVLQEKWVLHIVHALLDGPKGFNELGRIVGGCNPTTLTQRLSKLEELGVLHREPGQAGGRCSYSLTEAGLGLERVIAAIRSWASAHLRNGSTARDV
jgi:DNA-binding HxlR family transcriptional regulator